MNFYEFERIMTGIFIVGILMIVLFLFGNLIYIEYYEQKLCSEKLGIEYSIWYEPAIFHESIDRTNYNCCWYGSELTDNGYIKKKKCRGFVR